MADAAKSAGVDPKIVQAVPSINYVTYVAIWNNSSSSFDLRKVDEGTANPTGSMATAFSIDFADAGAVREFFQNSQGLYLVMDLRVEAQVPAQRDTKAIDDLIGNAVSQNLFSPVMPALQILKSLENGFASVIGANPNYAADAVTCALSTLSLSLDDHGAAVYSSTGATTLHHDLPTVPVRILDRVAAALKVDLSQFRQTEHYRLGEDWLRDLGELLDRK